MALDPSIILASRHYKMNDPADVQAKVQTITANKMAIQGAREAKKSKNLMAQAYKNSFDPTTQRLDRNKLVSSLASSGQGAEIADIRKSFADIDRAESLAKKAEIDQQYEQLQISMQDIASVNNPALAVQKITKAMQDGSLDQNEGKQLIAAIQANPQALEGIKRGLLQKGMTAKQQLDAQRSEIDQDIKRIQLESAGINLGNLKKGQFNYQKTDAGLVPTPKFGLPEGAETGTPLEGTGAPGMTETELSVGDPESGSILGATGLSMPGFLAITGQASKLPRDKVTRNKAFRQAEAFAKAQNVDISTLASQYDAYNKTLQSNIMRNNQTNILEQEISATIDTFKPIADEAGMGNLKVGNVVNLFAGKQFNDPVVQKYSQQILMLRSELAGMNAAARGNIDQTGNVKTDQSDMHDAEGVILNGINSGGLEGLREAVEQTTEKNSQVLKNNIDASRRAIWALFGVGGQYQNKYKEEQAEEQSDNEVDSDNPLLR